jgi:hypothetical protein
VNGQAKTPEAVMKLVSLLNQESLTDELAMVLTFPALPVYAKPWVRAGRKKSFDMVDDAVEKNPFNPRTVVVELYPTLTVNGKEVKFESFVH